MKPRLHEIQGIDDLNPADYNPRKISKAAASGLAASMARFGDISGITYNARTGHLICGHQRVGQLRALGAKLEKYADGAIALVHGDERFPVRVVDWPAEKERPANIAANNEHIAGSFTADLQPLLAQVESDHGIGYMEELQLTPLRDMKSIRAEEDEAPCPPTVSVCKPGDLWKLGDHRIMCGDATCGDSVSKLNDGKTPFIMVTDPPYGVEYDPSWRHDAGINNSKRVGVVENDDQADWENAYKHFRGSVLYVWHAGKYSSVVSSGIENCGFVIRSQIIWRKLSFAMGRSNYHWQHEPCWYAVRNGEKSHWTGGRKQSTIWDIDNHTGVCNNKDDAQTKHGTQKPVECMARPMRNHGKAGDIVYDPFLGSGTSIIAACQSDRVCFGLELSPEYCDVIIERWENYTGGKAERL